MGNMHIMFLKLDTYLGIVYQKRHKYVKHIGIYASFKNYNFMLN